MKRKYIHSCPIMRVMRVTRYSLNINTGEQTLIGSEIETKPCATPTFGRPVCSSCATGWETDGNTFANDDERARAQALARKAV